MDGGAWTTTGLNAVAGVVASTTGGHLKRFLSSGLVIGPSSLLQPRRPSYRGTAGKSDARFCKHDRRARVNTPGIEATLSFLYFNYPWSFGRKTELFKCLLRKHYQHVPPSKMEAALPVGRLAIGTGEFAIMGLMPEIAKNLNLTEPQVGHAISAYALGVMVGAPLLAILGAKMLRKHLLILLMLLYAAGNLATAFTPTFESLMIFRFISGLPHGAYFGIAAVVASGMAPINKRAGAVARVMIGLTLAMLLGNAMRHRASNGNAEELNSKLRQLRIKAWVY
jgi:hypothetical protein